jgi:hypothetical protein
MMDREIREWKMRKNEELERMFRKENILSVIRSRRLQWAGHAMRSQNHLIRMIMDENPVSRRPLERPRLWWGRCDKKIHEKTERRTGLENKSGG